MDKKVACVIISCFALANAGLIPVPSANILEGPSTRTQVIGPDGSVIDAYAPGGRIVLENNAGPLLQPAPVVLAQPAVADPQVYSPLELQQVVLDTNSVEAVQQNTVSEEAVQQDIVSVEATSVDRVSEDGQRVFLHPGTPERVETRESVPIREETEETPLATTEYVESTTADLSGTYVPDNFERSFDDGSYRPEHY